ncbi:hypothetical protein [Coxiella-like endosymbiont]|uniref:hypothetical protein n=1 Tax=Coxiella-like endosymbiont TaxID=1592897 RepID=UPI00272D2819|nr:hypothetical protein [Coxiella-like endosymbiont]
MPTDDAVKNLVINNSPDSSLTKHEFLEVVVDVLYSEYHDAKRLNFPSSLFKGV